MFFDAREREREKGRRSRVHLTPGRIVTTADNNIIATSIPMKFHAKYIDGELRFIPQKTAFIGFSIS